MYTTSDKPILLFQLPNTLLGDAAVTIILQCIITWVVELLLVNSDLKSGGIQPVGFIAEPTSKVLRWFMFLDLPQTRSAAGGGKQDDGVARPGGSSSSSSKSGKAGLIYYWVLFVLSQALRGFLFAIPSFLLLWGPTAGILTTVGARYGGDWIYEQKWVPQIFKLLLGGVLGILVTPLYALFWMTRCGWAIKNGEMSYGEK